MARPRIPGQSSIRWTAEADPRYCASTLCRYKRLQRPTRTLTVDGRTFRLCTECARKWEGIHGAVVEPIREVAHA